MKANGTTKRRSTKRGGATDWSQLGRRTPAQIREGVGADPEAHATDAQFWKTAKEEVLKMTIEQVVSSAGDGILHDHSLCSEESFAST